MNERVICLAVTDDEQVGHSWGKAPRVAVVTVADGAISDFTIHDVAWDVSRDSEPHGTHHGRIVRFLLDNNVTDVVSGRMGDSMANTLQKLGVAAHVGIEGDARAACLAVSS